MNGTGQSDFRESFFEECEELLETMQDGFDRLARGGQDEEAVNAVFRAVHSIKGGAGAFGLTGLVGFAHRFETALDHIRAGRHALDPDLLDLFRQCGDTLCDLVAAARETGDTACEASMRIWDRLNEALGGISPAEEEEEVPDFEPVSLDLGPGSGMRLYDIFFAAGPGLFASGNEPVVLFRSLEKLGGLTVSADLGAVPPLAELDPAVCAIEWRMVLETGAGEADIREVFEFVEADCRLEIAARGDDGQPDAGDGLPSLAELAGIPEEQPPPGDEGAAAEDTPNPAGAAPGPGGTIRVDLGRVDRLINLVGELVVKEAMLSQSVASLAPSPASDVSVALENLKQLTGELQEGVMAIRAQPVKPVFQRLARIARETGAATGKRVRFVTHGEYTEVDKTVLERLIDPLTHMIRNAVDHGLENGDVRDAAGKPAEGTVTLSAAHRSGRVLIEVADDGGGIDRDGIRKIAIERGLISEGDTLSAGEIDNLMFLPGFSSKDEVSELSGRGVGLDVVRSAIQAFGGRIAIQSEPGEGTAFSISLPLTLAVLEGMVIRVAGQTMVVPVPAIRETLRPASATIHSIGAGGRVLKTRGGLAPVIDLGAALGFRAPPERLDAHVLLLIETDNDRRYALIVDDIREQRQVVIKSLETNYRQVPGIAAATILGDGRIALIIDPDTVAEVRAAGQGDFPLQMAV